MERQTEICIAGGGPAGTLLACLLARRGANVILIEKQPVPGPSFRGEILNGDGEGVLRKHGLLERIAPEAVLPLVRLEYWENRRVVKTILPDKEGGNVGVHIPQADLLRALLDEAGGYPNFTYLPGTTVRGLLKDEAGRCAGVRVQRADGSKEEIRSALVVGADGRYSSVRRHAGIPASTQGHGYDLLWARIPAPEGWEPVMCSTIQSGQQLHLFTQARGFVQIGWNIAEDSYGELRKRPFEELTRTLIEAFPKLAPSVREHIRSWKDFVLLDIFSSRSESWAQPGLVLIGDAAHTMTPTGAFGLNEALRDADVLYEELLECLERRQRTELPLERLEQRRRADVERRQREQFYMESEYAQNFYNKTDDNIHSGDK
ncbi:FAD-dependent monooxygenase [Saccharibacillus sp. CPCC 101409]|uniref:FAD-dependent monooxygenase n=1 Tax=Saccharibacillus sp. CPCC 101409 TaxID=3058041 RepID=UPI0026729EA7|nr:FAD-dependent monooxygenase [Saccharibacillus sp. CPCC 101409]MDO3411563.1 FAD-dependent monooxygenase [Saccharibacillus sp. CPCC 101409]